MSEGRGPSDIVIQLRAVTDALGQVGFRLVATGLTSWLARPAEAVHTGYALDEVQRLFTTLT